MNRRSRIGLAAVTLLLSALPFVANALTYESPITITKGGTYTGNWQSLDPNTPAVSIRTTDPVTITDSNIQSKGMLIDANYTGADVTVTDTNGYALNPGVKGAYPGRFLEADTAANVIVEHDYFEGTRGIYIVEPESGATIRIRYNSAKNLSARQSTGSGWTTSDVNPEVAQLVQFDKVVGATAEVAWNQVINEPYVSRPEDVINMYASAGTAANPIKIHDNYIRGSYPGNPDTDDFSGGGIIADGPSTSYLEVYNNQVIETVNYGIAIAGGSHNDFYDNTVLGTGLLPDGARAAAQNVGMYVNGSGTGNTMHDNTVAWYNASGDRNDAWFPNCPDTTCAYNNTHLDSTSLSTEDQQFTVWQNKLTAAGISVGPQSGSDDSSSSAPPVAVPSASITGSRTSITLGDSAVLSWNSANASSCTGVGFNASGTSGSATVTPTHSTTYTVTCTGTGGSASASVSITVAVPAPTATISVSPATVTAGTQATVSWDASNAVSCTGTNFSASGTSGSVAVAPSGTTMYTIMCTGNGGSVTESTTLTVSAPPASSAGNSGSGTVITTPLPMPPTPQSSGAGENTSTVVSTPLQTASSDHAATSTNDQKTILENANIGFRERVTDYLRVHSDPSLSDSNHVCTQNPGAEGTIVSGPQTADGYTWWHLNFDANCDGWVVGDYIVQIPAVAQLPGSSTSVSIVPYTGGSITPQNPSTPASASAAPQTAIFTRALSTGAQGDDVRALQEFLRTHGYYSYDVTGYFGPITAAAVRQFQGVHGLEQVGSVGPLTRALLNLLEKY